MSISKKLIVITELKDVLRICKTIEGSLTRLLATQKAKRFDRDNLLSRLELHTHGSVEFYFSCKGEKRNLSVYFYCDCDYRQDIPEGDRLIISLGDWGSVDKILSILAKDLYDAFQSDVYFYSDISDTCARLY